MSDDELPPLTSPDDPTMDHLEWDGPYQPTTYALLNGLRVPHVTHGGEEYGQVFITLDNRLAFPFPKESAEMAIKLVANAIAIERGYGCFPRTPGEQDMPKRPAWGPVVKEFGYIATKDDKDE